MGFTLVEMAVVLVIFGVMIGGLVVPLTAQQDQRNYTETRLKLNEIREALIGFAVLNGRLPCPSTQTDPAHANYGQEDASCTAAVLTEGYLPWKTLGVAEMDAWGVRRTASTSPWTGYWRYRVDRNFSVAFALTTNFSADALAVQDSGGNLLSGTERPVFIVYSAGKNLVADGENADYESAAGLYQSDAVSTAYDDLLIWAGRPLLMNRMVMAERLP